jgi:hypothetical protein
VTLPDSVGVTRNSDKQGFGHTDGFFSAPFLQVESMQGINAEVQIGTKYNDDYSLRDVQTFECLPWVVKIHSRNPAFSILNSAHADAYVTTSMGESTSNASRLPWKNMKKLPDRFVTNVGITEGEDPRKYYKKIFAYYYGEELRRLHVDRTVDIRKGVTMYLYFLLTFKDSPYAYVMTMSDYAEWSDNKNVFYDSIGGFSLALPLNDRYKFEVRFYGNGDDGKKQQGGKIDLNLDIQSWDKILWI